MSGLLCFHSSERRVHSYSARANPSCCGGRCTTKFPIGTSLVADYLSKWLAKHRFSCLGFRWPILWQPDSVCFSSHSGLISLRGLCFTLKLQSKKKKYRWSLKSCNHHTSSNWWLCLGGCQDRPFTASQQPDFYKQKKTYSHINAILKGNN